MTIPFIIAALVLIHTPWAPAQPSAPPVPVAVASPANDPAEQLALWVDDATIVVVRVDLSRADPSGLLADLREQLEKATPSGKLDAHTAEVLATVTREIKTWREGFVSAGGKEIWAISSLFDLVMHRSAGPPVLLVVPVSATSDREKMRASLAQLPQDFGKAPKDVDGFIVIGATDRIGPAPADEPNAPEPRLPLAKPTRASDIRTAIAEAGDLPVQLFLIPADYARRAFEEMAPTLPKSLGAAPITTVTRGVKWAAASVSLPPQGSLRVVAQSQDAAAATALAEFFSTMLDTVSKDPNFIKVPGFVKLAGVIKPRVEGDRVVWLLDGEPFRTVVAYLAPALMVARQEARKVVAASQIRQMLMGCWTYAADHKDVWPETLEVLSKAEYITPDVLKHPEASRAFLFRKPTNEDLKSGPATLIVIYESFDTWPADGLWVGFGDGHVERIADKAKFDELKKAAK